MEQNETTAILTLALLAAFADGAKDPREREAVRKVAEALGDAGGTDLAQIYRDVLIGKPDVAEVAARLATPEARRLAYEMAVGVCDADGAQTAAEAQFLASLAAALKLPEAEALASSARAEAIAAAPIDATPIEAGVDPAVVSGPVLAASRMAPAEQDQLIHKAAITNAALELLPESLASMAIIPLQMRLVYRIGQSYGYPMDASHAKDFIATLGVGLTGQYLEQFGRKLLGGVLGGLGGGLGRMAGRQAASSGMSFATTYAIGRVAQHYYAGGRTLDAARLKETFTALLAEARQLAPRYQAEITQKAQGIDTSQLAALIKQI